MEQALRRRNTGPRKIRRLIVLLVLVVLTPAATITVGPAAVPIQDVLGVIASHIGKPILPVAGR